MDAEAPAGKPKIQTKGPHRERNKNCIFRMNVLTPLLLSLVAMLTVTHILVCVWLCPLETLWSNNSSDNWTHCIFIRTCQELNRLRKAALAFGFWELLKGVADLLERECTLLPDSAHPDAAFQLSHAAQQLKLASTGDSQYAAFDHNIVPMHTDFSSWATREWMNDDGLKYSSLACMNRGGEDTSVCWGCWKNSKWLLY